MTDLIVVSESIEPALCGLYRDLIQFFLDATHFLTRNPVKNLIHFVIPWRRQKDRHLEGDFSALYARIQEHTDLIDTVANEALHKVTHKLISRTVTQILSALPKIEPRSIMTISASKVHRIIPYVQNRQFFGRDDELSRLEQALVRGKHKQLSIVSVLGEGGVGKSQLALQFAYSHFHDFNAIFWVASETHVKLAQSFEKIAVEVGLVQPSGNQGLLHDSRDLVKKWLRTTGEPHELHEVGRLLTAK